MFLLLPKLSDVLPHLSAQGVSIHALCAPSTVDCFCLLLVHRLMIKAGADFCCSCPLKSQTNLVLLGIRLRLSQKPALHPYVLGGRDFTNSCLRLHISACHQYRTLWPGCCPDSLPWAESFGIYSTPSINVLLFVSRI